MQILNVSITGGLNLELTPSFVFLSTNVPTIVEGNTFTITFTTNRPGVYPYTITGINTNDISNASLTGTFTANGETRTYTVSDDLITEGRETFSIALDNGQTFATVGIDDSYYTLTANVVSADEGNVFSVTLDTNGIHALPLGYTITGGVSSSDFIGSPSLTGNLTSNGQVLTFTANADLILDGVEYFTISLNNGRANANVIINDTSLTPPGQIEYTIPGTYSWVAPAGVSNISVLAVGAGGGGYQGGASRYSGGGGGGGGLVWVNNVAVTSGTTYSITVGAGTPANNPSTPGGGSWFNSNTYIAATGGDSGKDQVIPQASGGFPVNNSGFTGGGGNGGAGGPHAGEYSGTGGGGAGGYSGNGGTGSQGAYGYSITSTAGSGGGGGGGGATTNARWGSAGGGVGIYGQGTNGAAGGVGEGGYGGSGGSNGGNGPTALGGSFGGGGGGGTINSPSYTAGPGANGAVRLMWSGYNPTFLARAYPSTNTANV
jgi:hypothetical protein